MTHAELKGRLFKFQRIVKGGRIKIKPCEYILDADIPDGVEVEAIFYGNKWDGRSLEYCTVFKSTNDRKRKIQWPRNLFRVVYGTQTDGSN